jgi:unsaturated rhamnogalacturonyl hydrolase
MDYQLKPIIDLSDSIIRQLEPKMKWMWGEALLGYALSELDAYMGTERYTGFLKGYCDYYVNNEPRVDQSDTSAPALITYAMEKKTGNSDYARLTNKVLNYIKHEPRVMDDAVNHLGNSPEGKLYPKSIWVDSLMMFSVFTTRYAREKMDQELMTFASRQPRLYASYMQNVQDKLWVHSYWVKGKHPYPKHLYWGRGNGWVMCSLPMILKYLPEDHREREGIIEIFKETSRALVHYQREDGYFETVLNRPGKTYRESSATALIAAGWFEGARNGWIEPVYGQYALKAYKALLQELIYQEGEVYMPEISGPTIPLQLLPYIGYKVIPKGKNWSYGVAAMIFAGIAYDQWTKAQVVLPN